MPQTPTDFVDGLVTYGGQGSPRLRRGFAIHLYAANRSMDDRAFYDADGDLLLVPQLGRLTVMTELGPLQVMLTASKSGNGKAHFTITKGEVRFPLSNDVEPDAGVYNQDIRVLRAK